MEQHYNFTFDDIEAHPEHINNTPFYNETLCGDQPYLIIHEDRTFNPHYMQTFLRPIYIELIDHPRKAAFAKWVRVFYPRCEGQILYDYDDLSHDELRNDRNKIPSIFINRTDGKLITDDLGDFTVNLSYTQIWNTSVQSFNLIGQINGTDTNRSHIIVVNSLYDSMWNSGTADSSIGVGIVLALGKYYHELNQTYGINPKYTIQFVLFGGEEAGGKGAWSYRAKHQLLNYTIEKFIDFNQLCYNQTKPQDPDSTLYIGTSSKSLRPILHQIKEQEKTDYTQRVNRTNLKDIYRYFGMLSDDEVYDSEILPCNRADCIVFLKGMNWYRHHRDGMNHTEGDSMNYYDDADVAATANIILNVTKYFCLNPDCNFTSIDDHPWLKDPPEGHSLRTSVQVNYTIKTILPYDHVWVNATLISQHHPNLGRYGCEKVYNVTPEGITGNITVTLPSHAFNDYYTLHVNLYNSTGRIDHKANVIHKWQDTGQYSNDSRNYTQDVYYMSPSNIPSTPTTPEGQANPYTGIFYNYTTNITNANNTIYYQWQLQTKGLDKNITLWSRWIHARPTGEGYKWLLWTTPGNYNISVRALSSPHFYVRSNWSQNLPVNVSMLLGGSPAWNNEFLNSFSLTTLGVGQETSCGGLIQGMTMNQNSNAILNWTWDYGDGSHSHGHNATHNYDRPGNYTIHLTIRDDQNHYFNCTQNITVLILNAGFRMSGDWQPGKQVRFNDTSMGQYPISTWTWDFGDGNTSILKNPTHNYTTPGVYNVTLAVQDDHYNIHINTQQIHVEALAPELSDVIAYPDPALINTPVTIAANLDDNLSDIKEVKVNITTPDNISINATMTQNNLTEYDYTYIFNDTNLPGTYNYSIWAVDNANNTNYLSGFTFTVLQTPIVQFETPPTPVNNTMTTQTWAQIKVTVQDNFRPEAFIDWNHTLHGYWPMDGYNTTGITDNSTYHNFGVFQGGLGPSNIVPGKFGKALHVDGIDDSVNLGHDPSLNLGTGDFTVIVWEKSTPSYTGDAVILSNQPGIVANGYSCAVTSSGTKLYTKQGSQTTVLTGTTDVTTNTWHQLAYVRNGTNLSIYIDGSLDSYTSGTVRDTTNTQDTLLTPDTSGTRFNGYLDEAQLYTRALSPVEIQADYNATATQITQTFTNLPDGIYTYSAYAMDISGNHSTTETRTLTIDTTPPSITNITITPSTAGFGATITIQADITDSLSGLNQTYAHIHLPAAWHGVTDENLTMTPIGGNRYQATFNHTWLTGTYNVTIHATDNLNNTHSTQFGSSHYFNITTHAILGVATLADTYGRKQDIDLTDPPETTDNLTLVDSGQTWNTYYNATSGDNILETSTMPINYQNTTGNWTPINTTITPLNTTDPAYTQGYRTGNDQGLYTTYYKPNLTDPWPIAFAYNQSTDPTTNTLRTKLISLAYLDPQTDWTIHTLQTTQTTQGQTNNNTITYPSVFTGTDLTLTYGALGLKEDLTLTNTTRDLLTSQPPSLYGLNDTSSLLVTITRLDTQDLTLYHGTEPITGNTTITTNGIDLKDTQGVFKCAMPLGDAYELANDTNRHQLMYRIIYTSDGVYLLAGLRLTDLQTMTYPIDIDPTITLYSSSNDGYIYASNAAYLTAHNSATGTIDSTSSSIYIGQRRASGTYTVYRGFLYFNTSQIPSNAIIDSAKIGLYKVADYSTTDFQITIQNGQPTYPHSPMQTGDYSLAHYMGNGGTFDTAAFKAGYNDIPMNSAGLSWINRTSWTKLCLRSSRDITPTSPTGDEYVTVTSNEFTGIGCQPRLVIAYRNHSKIKNTGSTDIEGYLQIQVQYHNATGWHLENDAVNETTPRTISHGDQLALDAIFNGLVKTDDLTHGSGTYRVYAAFRDPEGNILVDSDGYQLMATYEFTVTF